MPLALPRNPRISAGFTLVEMSIVLVIIALVVGGVMIGKMMIETATSRAVLSELDHFESAALTFKNKYGYLPGDLPNAGRFGFVTITSGFGANGNGNGLVESYANISYQAGEVILFWRHLQNAGLIQTTVNDQLTDSCAPNGTAQPFSQYYPQSHALNNNATAWFAYPGYSQTHDATYGKNPTYGGSYDGNNYFMLANPSDLSTCVVNINTANSGYYHPQVAYYIDSKRDDGMPESGNVMIVANSGNQGYKYGLPNFYSPTSCLTSTTNYNLKNYAPLTSGNWGYGGCTLRIKASF